MPNKYFTQAYLFQCFLPYIVSVSFPWKENIKLSILGLPNRILDDSDSKPSKFECLFGSDSKSDNKIIKIKFNQCLIKGLKKSIKRSKKLIKRSKKLNLTKNINLYWLYWLSSITFDILINFELFTVTRTDFNQNCNDE